MGASIDLNKSSNLRYKVNYNVKVNTVFVDCFPLIPLIISYSILYNMNGKEFHCEFVVAVDPLKRG